MARWPPLSDKRGETKWGSRPRFIISKLPPFLFLLFVFAHENSFDLSYLSLMMFFVSLNGFANKNAAIPNFNLVNQQSLDKILKAKVFVHTDGQLRATHLILDYIPISKSFQVPKCFINAKDPRLHRISIAAPSFLISDPILEGTLVTNPIPEGIPKEALPSWHTAEEATSSHPAITKEEEEKEEEVVEVSDSEDQFNVFNQPLSLEVSPGDLGFSSPAQSNHYQEATNTSDEMGIQRKQRSTLQELLESQPEGHAPGKVA